MNYKKNLVYILIIFFSITSISKSSENIAYLDLDNLVKNTKAGKLIIDKLKVSKDSALKTFEQKEKALKKVEEDLNKQKNVLSKEELKSKVLNLRKEISSFRSEKEKLINNYNIKKTEEFKKFFKKINPIIGKYVEEKKITAGHAKFLVGLENAVFIAKKIIEKKLSVRQAETFVKIFKKKEIPSNNFKDPNIKNLELSIVNKIGLNVVIKNKKNNKGTIIFSYQDVDQLNKIIDIIKFNY